MPIHVSPSPILPFPTLETERLLLREIRTSDASEIFKMMMDREVTRCTSIPRAQRYKINQLQRQRLPDHLKYQKRKRMLWAITRKPEDHLIGRCGYEEWLPAAQVTEIGYWMARVCWGEGIMTEAIAAILHYGFDRMDLEEVNAWVIEGNPASVRVLEKSGFYYDSSLQNDIAGLINPKSLNRYILNKKNYMKYNIA